MVFWGQVGQQISMKKHIKKISQKHQIVTVLYVFANILIYFVIVSIVKFTQKLKNVKHLFFSRIDWEAAL